MLAKRLLVGCGAAALLAFGGLHASAAVFTDTAGDNINGSGNYNLDITSLNVTNDATNLTFTLNFNPSATLNTGTHYEQYEIELHTGPGGQTLINANYGTTTANGNPYGTSVGSSSGVNAFLAIYSGGGPFGGDSYTFNSSTGWTRVALPAVTPTATSLTMSIPLTSLGLVVGNSFNVDAFSTFAGANGQYDALSLPTTFTGTPYYNGATPPTNYDSTTGSAYAGDVYTVAATPEPASLALLGLGGTLMFLRRGRI